LGITLAELSAATVWTRLTTPPDAAGVLTPFAALYLAVFAAGFVASAYVTGPAAEAIARNPAQLSGLRHWARIGLWIFGAGLFFFGMRALQINPLSFAAPIWLALSTIAAIIFIIRCASWWRITYPALLARDPNVPIADSR
jgi:hypothetical protein